MWTRRPPFPLGRRFTPDERRRVVAAYKRAGLSRSRFCEEAGICTATLVRWLAEAEAHELRPAPLVPVTIVDELPAPRVRDSGRFEVRLPSGVEIAVPSRFDRASLESLLHAVRAATC